MINVIIDVSSSFPALRTSVIPNWIFTIVSNIGTIIHCCSEKFTISIGLGDITGSEFRFTSQTVYCWVILAHRGQNGPIGIFGASAYVDDSKGTIFWKFKIIFLKIQVSSNRLETFCWKSTTPSKISLAS